MYGVVKQSGGYIWVYSEIGLGSTFKIYLPRVDDPIARNKESDMGYRSLQGSATILLVEDQESLRTLTRTVLEQSGFKVLEADGGNHAIEVAKGYPGLIHLLLTDMIMPGINGRKVAETLMPMRPGMSVIYMSGYMGFTPSEDFDPTMNFLSKPVPRDALLRKVHEVLGRQNELELREEPAKHSS